MVERRERRRGRGSGDEGRIGENKRRTNERDSSLSGVVEYTLTQISDTVCEDNRGGIPSTDGSGRIIIGERRRRRRRKGMGRRGRGREGG